MTKMSLRLLLVLVAATACVHGAAWQHRSLRSSIRKTVWPLASFPVPDFSDDLQEDVVGIDPQIVGGHDAADHQFPHQVSMQITDAPYSTHHICGGTLIAPKWVLTAAHCAWGVPEFTSAFVFAGKTNLLKREEGQVRADVSDMYAHEDYRTDWNRGVGPNDVALLKLLTPIEETDTIKFAKLPVANAIPTGSATLSGWGSISMTSQLVLPAQLQTAELPINDFAICQKFISGMEPDEVNPLRDTNVCAGPLGSSGLSSCQGDSGGPLIQLDPADGKVTVIGIVSWGYTPCGRDPAPSVFTRTSAFVSWINYVMAHNSA